MKKITCFAALLLAMLTAEAQELRLSSALHLQPEKVTIYREWPSRRLIDTLMMTDGHLQYQLPDSGAAVYSIRMRKPFVNTTFFAAEKTITIQVGKDTQVVVQSNDLQRRQDDFERSMKPIEATWSALGTKYGKTENLDEKLAINAEIGRIANGAEERRLAFVMKNAGNLAGAWSAYHYAYAWRPASLTKLIAAYQQQAWAKTTYTALQEKQREAAKLNMTGKPAPRFTLLSSNNKQLSLDSLLHQNKYVLVDVWASWCTPCRAGNRKLAPHYEKFRQKGIEIVSVSVDEKETLWRKAVAEDKIPWPQLITLNGMKSDIVLQYKVQSLPATFLINDQGIIIQQHVEIADLEKLK